MGDATNREADITAKECVNLRIVSEYISMLLKVCKVHRNEAVHSQLVKSLVFCRTLSPGDVDAQTEGYDTVFLAYPLAWTDTFTTKALCVRTDRVQTVTAQHDDTVQYAVSADNAQRYSLECAAIAAW